MEGAPAYSRIGRTIHPHMRTIRPWDVPYPVLKLQHTASCLSERANRLWTDDRVPKAA